MPFLAPPIIAALIGAGATTGSALLNRRGQKTTSQGGPVLNQGQQNLQQKLIQHASSQLGAPSQAGGAFQANRNQAVSTINRNTDFASKRLETRLAGRGFGRSGLIAAGNNELEQNRTSAIGNIETQLLNFLERQKVDERQQRFQNALSLLPNQFPQQGSSTSKQGFDPFQFLQPFLFSEIAGGGGGGGGGAGAGGGDNTVTLPFPEATRSNLSTNAFRGFG